jgi:hypothetical protein
MKEACFNAGLLALSGIIIVNPCPAGKDKLDKNSFFLF